MPEGADFVNPTQMIWRYKITSILCTAPPSHKQRRTHTHIDAFYVWKYDLRCHIRKPYTAYHIDLYIFFSPFIAACISHLLRSALRSRQWWICIKFFPQNSGLSHNSRGTGNLLISNSKKNGSIHPDKTFHTKLIYLDEINRPSKCEFKIK